MKYYIDQEDRYNVKIERPTDFAQLQSLALVPEKGALYHYGDYTFKLHSTSKDLFLVRRKGSFRPTQLTGLDSLIKFLQDNVTITE